MLEHLLPWWGGKLFVLTLLGFAATDFIITITLSAADATAHLLENPFCPGALHGHTVGVTLVLVALLGGVFLKGFKEAIGIAVVLVAVYLVLNAVVITDALMHVFAHPHHFVDWKNALFAAHGSPLAMIGVSLLLFPKLALGLSGFETGVAMMPLVQGDQDDDPDRPEGKIRATHRLLFWAAVVMSVYLIASSLATTLLIAPADFQPGHPANGRALAFLAHKLLGNGFGTVYDVSTICILWFAGASAMAGLLNLVPRYLPRYGMAPEWARAARPLTLIYMAIAFAVTLIFRADVDAQGGAYATGVLVLMTSAAVAVTLSVRREHKRWGGWPLASALVAVVFAYTTVRQRHRAARRREDRGVFHRGDCGVVDPLAGVAHDGAAGEQDHVRRGGGRVHPRPERERDAAHHRQPSRPLRRAGIRPVGGRDARNSEHPRGRPGVVPGNLRAGRKRVHGGSERARGDGERVTGCCAGKARRCRTPSRRFCCICATTSARCRTRISTGASATRFYI